MSATAPKPRTDRRLFLKLATVGTLLSPLGTGGVAANHRAEQRETNPDRAMSNYSRELRSTRSDVERLSRHIDAAQDSFTDQQRTLENVQRDVVRLVETVDLLDESLDDATSLDLEDDDELEEFDDLKESIADSIDDALILLLDAKETLEDDEDRLADIELEFGEQLATVEDSFDAVNDAARVARRADLRDRDREALDDSLAYLRDASGGLRDVERSFFREEYDLARGQLERVVNDLEDAESAAADR
jgi:chromosome segregation ATPase